MGYRNIVKQEAVIIYFTFKDGCVVRSYCTANKQLAEESGCSYLEEGLYDLDVNKRIPNSYMDLDCKIYKTDEEEKDTRDNLDMFLEEYIKNTW